MAPLAVGLGPTVRGWRCRLAPSDVGFSSFRLRCRALARSCPVRYALSALSARRSLAGLDLLHGVAFASAGWTEEVLVGKIALATDVESVDLGDGLTGRWKGCHIANGLAPLRLPLPAMAWRGRKGRRTSDEV